MKLFITNTKCCASQDIKILYCHYKKYSEIACSGIDSDGTHRGSIDEEVMQC